ncbi:MAG: hypothetical protein PHO10_09730 [Gemmiger sp.]|nr:hypothetical protein [Gemmiger sp.]
MQNKKPGKTRRRVKADKATQAAGRELQASFAALRANDGLFQLATEGFYIEQLIYERAALLCHCRTLLQGLRQAQGAGAQPKGEGA